MESLIDRKSPTLDDYVKSLSDEALNGDFEEIFKRAPLSKDALCGIGSCRGRTLQRQEKYYFFPEIYTTKHQPGSFVKIFNLRNESRGQSKLESIIKNE
jgi:hypothetical protein